MVTHKTQKSKSIKGKSSNSKHNKVIKLCNICYDEKNKKFIKCPKCRNNCCKKCWETNIKIKSRISDCLTLNCDYNSTREFIFNNFSKKFLKEWINMQTSKLIVIEKRLVEESRRNRLNKNNNSNAFQFKCPSINCKGFFYTDEFKCTLCLKDICKECHKISDINHECKLEEKEEIKELMKNITQCPNCKEVINRSAGCNDMYCTKCKTHFNFRTKKETNYRHNPHAPVRNINNDINEQNNFIDRSKFFLSINIHKEMNIKLQNFNDCILKLKSFREKNYKESDKHLSNNVKLFDKLVENEMNKRFNNNISRGHLRNFFGSNYNLPLIQDDRLTEIEKRLGITERNLLKDIESDSILDILEIKNNNDKMNILSALKSKNYNLVNNIISKLKDNKIDEDNETIYNIGDRTLYYKLKNKIYIIDLESKVLKNIYILDDHYTKHKVIYVSEKNIILYKTKELIEIKRGDESKSMILDIKMVDNKINLNIEFIIDIDKKLGRIMMLCDQKNLLKEIISLNLESGEIINKWDLPSVFLSNCKNIVYVRWANIFIFNMIDNLQIFNINSVDRRLDFITVLVTNNDKICYDNKHNSKYVVGIYKSEVFRNVVNSDIFHNIIDIHELKIVNRIKIVGFYKSNVNEIYYESKDTYYHYNNTYNENISFVKVKLDSGSFNFKSSTNFDYFSTPVTSKLHKFIPSLKIIFSRIKHFYNKDELCIPYINNYYDDYEMYEKNIKNLLANIVNISSIKNRYNVNDIHNFNSNARNSLLRNRITENAFEIKIKKNYTQFNKTVNLYNILNSVEGLFRELLEKYKNRYILDRNNLVNEIENTEKNLNKKLEDNYNIYGGDKFKINIFGLSRSEVFKRVIN